MHMRLSALAAVLACGLFLSGCAEIEPKSGTRVVLRTSGKPLTREQIAEVSRHLVRRSIRLIGAKRARIENARDNTFVLLLPGARISRDQLMPLIKNASLEFYHLRAVATRSHPDRPWKLKQNPRDGSHIFLGPGSQRIVGGQNDGDLLTEVAGYPRVKPILTGRDLAPSASTRQTAHGWAVLVTFNESGAAKFRQFTTRNRGEFVGAFHDGRLLSIVQVDKPITGREVFITGFRTLRQAESAAAQMGAGRLPAKLKITSVNYY